VLVLAFAARELLLLRGDELRDVSRTEPLLRSRDSLTRSRGCVLRSRVSDVRSRGWAVRSRVRSPDGAARSTVRIVRSGCDATVSLRARAQRPLE
jgi:hypothetical protein